MGLDHEEMVAAKVFDVNSLRADILGIWPAICVREVKKSLAAMMLLHFEFCESKFLGQKVDKVAGSFATAPLFIGFHGSLSIGLM